MGAGSFFKVVAVIVVREGELGKTLSNHDWSMMKNCQIALAKKPPKQ